MGVWADESAQGDGIGEAIDDRFRSGADFEHPGQREMAERRRDVSLVKAIASASSAAESRSSGRERKMRTFRRARRAEQRAQPQGDHDA